jgi:hypothetical protein
VVSSSSSVSSPAAKWKPSVAPIAPIGDSSFADAQRANLAPERFLFTHRPDKA